MFWKIHQMSRSVASFCLRFSWENFLIESCLVGWRRGAEGSTKSQTLHCDSSRNRRINSGWRSACHLFWRDTAQDFIVWICSQQCLVSNVWVGRWRTTGLSLRSRPCQRIQGEDRFIFLTTRFSMVVYHTDPYYRWKWKPILIPFLHQ